MSGGREPADFRALQAAFAAHVRQPAEHAAPEGVDARRMGVYRDLLYRNVEGLLAQAFPVLRRLSSDAAWHARVRDFYARHRCHAPQFHRIAEEFVAFCGGSRGAHPDDPPFLADLVHYEWVEMALAIAPEEAPEARAFDPLSARLALSPLAWPLSYAWPVHRLGPDFQPSQPPPRPTHLIVHRDRDDEVRFLEIEPATARLLQLLYESPTSGEQALERIALEMGRKGDAAVRAAGRAALEDLRDRGILLAAS